MVQQVYVADKYVYSAQNSASNGTTPSITGTDEERSGLASSPTVSAGSGGANGFGGADSLQEQLMSEQSQSTEREAEASSLIKLTNGDVLYLREVNR
jgi:Ras-related GTP-binding protein C/D